MVLSEAYTNIKIPYTDLIYHAKLYLRKNWQFFWDQQVLSKLHAVYPELLSGDPPPVCVGCQERLSVDHIIIHCVEYIDIRYIYLNVNTVRELFDTIPPVLIISFIRRAGAVVQR